MSLIGLKDSPRLKMKAIEKRLVVVTHRHLKTVTFVKRAASFLHNLQAQALNISSASRPLVRVYTVGAVICRRLDWVGHVLPHKLILIIQIKSTPNAMERLVWLITFKPVSVRPLSLLRQLQWLSRLKRPLPVIPPLVPHH